MPGGVAASVVKDHGADRIEPVLRPPYGGSGSLGAGGYAGDEQTRSGRPTGVAFQGIEAECQNYGRTYDIAAEERYPSVTLGRTNA